MRKTNYRHVLCLLTGAIKHFLFFRRTDNRNRLSTERTFRETPVRSHYLFFFRTDANRYNYWWKRIYQRLIASQLSIRLIISSNIWSIERRKSEWDLIDQKKRISNDKQRSSCVDQLWICEWSMKFLWIRKKCVLQEKNNDPSLSPIVFLNRKTRNLRRFFFIRQ